MLMCYDEYQYKGDLMQLITASYSIIHVHVQVCVA